MTEKEALNERFWIKVRSGHPSQCWEWLAAKNSLGYGWFRTPKRTVLAHRFSYEYSHGQQIPAGLTVDHLCRNTSCVNPFHMELVTPSENSIRARAHMKKKTHCSKGHPFGPDDSYFNINGWRYCRECKRITDTPRKRVLRAKIRALVL